MTPSATGPTWVHVVTLAGRTCECTGVCGRSHAAAGGRCDRGHRHLVRDQLVVAPADPGVPPARAWRTPVEELAAWCGPCLDQARRQARTAPIPEQTTPLLAIDCTGGAS